MIRDLSNYAKRAVIGATAVLALIAVSANSAEAKCGYNAQGNIVNLETGKSPFGVTDAVIGLGEVSLPVLVQKP
jgi:hypothetical protein